MIQMGQCLANRHVSRDRGPFSCKSHFLTDERSLGGPADSASSHLISTSLCFPARRYKRSQRRPEDAGPSSLGLLAEW